MLSEGRLPGVGITAEQFKKMQERVAGTTRSVAPVTPSAPRTVPANSVIIGVDPSLRGTGFGVIRLSRQNPTALTHGTISCPATWPRSRCLLKISEALRDVVREHRPTTAAVEGLFFAQNLQTAIIMGEARGAALAVLAEGGMEIYEIAPRKVKQAIVGYGAAQKLAVAKMVQRMLNLTDLPDPDAADALALALAHAQTQGRNSLATPKKI